MIGRSWRWSLAGGTLVLISGLAWPGTAAGQRARLLVPIEQLEERAVSDSNDPAAHYAVALGYLMKKRFDDADRALRQAVSLEPKFADAYLALAYVPYGKRPKLWREESKGNVPAEWTDAMIESYRLRRRAFIIDPMVDLKVLGAVLPPREALGLTRLQLALYTELVKGFEFFWDAQYEQAFVWFDDLMRYPQKQKNPEPVPDWLLWYHGLAAAHTKRFPVAMTAFDTLLARALKRDTVESLQRIPVAEANDFRYILAVIKHQAGLYGEAERLYQEVLANDLGFYMAHARLAELHERRRNWLAASRERERAVEASPDDAGLLYDLGLAYAKAGYWSRADSTLRRAMDLNPRNARIPFVLADASTALRRPDDTRRFLKRFLALAPSQFGAQITDARQRLAELEP